MAEPTKQPQSDELVLQLFQNAQLLSRAMLSSRLGMQFDGQRDLYKTFGYLRAPGYQDYKNLYERQGMASRLVEKFANDTWNKPPVLIDGEARSDQSDKLTPFLQEWNELVDRVRVYKILRQADRTSGLSDVIALKTVESLAKLLQSSNIASNAKYQELRSADDCLIIPVPGD